MTVADRSPHRAGIGLLARVAPLCRRLRTQASAAGLLVAALRQRCCGPMEPDRQLWAADGEQAKWRWARCAVEHVARGPSLLRLISWP